MSIKKGRRRIRIWRLLLWGTLALLVTAVIAVGAIALYYSRNPVSNRYVHERIIQRLERITGLDASYDSADLNVPGGIYTIRGLRFAEPANPAHILLSFAQLEAEVNPVSLLRGKESVLKSVVLTSPSRLDMFYTTTGVRPGAAATVLLEAVRKAQAPTAGGSELALPFDSLTIENATVGLTEQQTILPDLDAPQPEVLVSGKVLIANDEEKGIVLGFEGQAAGYADSAGSTSSLSRASGIIARVHLSDKDNILLEASFDEARIAGAFSQFPNAVAKATGLTLSSSIQITSPSVSTKTTVDAARLQIANPGRDVDITDQDLRAEITFSTSVADKTWSVSNFSLNSRNITGGGRASYDEHQTLYVNGSSTRLASGYQELFRRHLPAGWTLDAPPEGLKTNLAVQVKDKKLIAIGGEIDLKGANVKAPGILHSIEGVSGNLKMTSAGIDLKEVHGRYANSDVSVEGMFHGNPLADAGGTIDLEWRITSDFAEVLKMVSQYTTASMSKFPAGKGSVSATGSYQQAVSLAQGRTLGQPAISGDIAFKDVTLDHPALPASLTALTGSINISGKRMQMNQVQGRMGGAEVALDGRIVGSETFWTDPQISATLLSRMDLAEVGDYLIPEDQKRLESHQLSGVATTRMALNGPIVALESAEMTGEMVLENVAFAPNLEFMTGNFSDVDATLTWNGTRLNLTNFTGKLNGQELQGSGLLSNNEVQFLLQGDSDLDNIASTFPAIGKFMKMNGLAAFDLKFSASSNQPAGNAGGLGATMEAAAHLIDSAVASKRFSLDGTLKLNDATVRHIAMPPSRKEKGKSIPAGELRSFTGSIRVAGDTLSISHDSPARCHLSDSLNCRVSGTMKLRPENFPQMDVRISSQETLNLDSWILGWGKELPNLPSPPMSGKNFELRAQLSAPALQYKGQRGGRSKGVIEFQMKQDRTPRTTTFKDIVIEGAQAGLGQVSGTGRIESYVWDSRQYPKWQSTINSRQMPIETMLAVIFAEPANISGMITGDMNLNGIGSNTQSIRGAGTAYMTNLSLGGSRVIQQLGQTAGRNFGGTLFETAQAASFEVGNGALSSRDLALQSSGLMMEFRGDYFFEGDQAQGIAPKAINGMVRLRLFKSVFGSIPIIGQVADLADEVANAFLLAFRISGTADSPRVTAVPLPLFTGGQ